MEKLILSGLFIYPIKSLKGIKMNAATLEEKGLSFDRRWMLIDNDGTFVSQRKFHSLALLEVNLDQDKNELSITDTADPAQTVSFLLNEHLNEPIAVTIWDDACSALEVNETVSIWFSNYLGFSVKLVVMPESEKRLVDARYATDGETVSFADGYPCLLIGQASLDALNEKLAEPIDMDRFRPNFVFTGGGAHFEDTIGSFRLNDLEFKAVKPCARCVLITVNQQTGIKAAEPLKTLAGYRTRNKKIMFGQNLIHRGTGEIKVGSELVVTSWKPAI